MRRICVPLLFLALACQGAFAIGGRIHAEIGLRCVEDHLIPSERMLPGIGEMFKTVEIKNILYRACVFPDWGYGGISQDAGEASHWHPFMRAWADVLGEKFGRKPLDGDAQKEAAFFLGAVCHNIADLPWHFGEPGYPSFLEMAQREDGASHTLAEIGSDLIRYRREPLAHLMRLVDYTPVDTIMAAMDRAGVKVERRLMETGMRRENIVLWGGVAVGFFKAEDLKKSMPWCVAHVEDYYYGGMRHGAAACAVWCRYWYADITGGKCLQQMPAYAPWIRGNGGYQPYLGVTDATVAEDLPVNNTGAESLLEVGGAPGKQRHALLRFDLASLPADRAFRSAILWLALANPAPQDGTVNLAAAAVATPWAEGGGVSDPHNGTDGRAGDGDEVCWNNAPAATGALALAAVAAGAAAGTWTGIDVTQTVREWAANPAKNHGIRVWAVDTPPSKVKFFSSQAFQADGSGYCGGERVAHRPMLVILP